MWAIDVRNKLLNGKMMKLKSLWVYSFMVMWPVLNHAYAQEEILFPYDEGVRIVLETKYFKYRGDLISHTIIMKKGKKMRIEETISLSSKGISRAPAELKRIIISDGEATWFISADGKKEKFAKPMRHPLGFMPCCCEKDRSEILDGRTVQVIETTKDRKDKWYIDLTTKMPLKREKDGRVTFYKEYELIEGGGYFPRSMETYERGTLIMRTIIKSVEKYKMLADELFDPNKVTLTKTGEERVGEYLPD